jgi:Bcr/CflA subfamily drug resistance transporter
MNTKNVKPTLWLIILIIGLPQLSETIYTPSLPDIAQSLGVSANLVEYTLSIYLLGFAAGVLFWGRLSDRIGRKPSLIAGLGIYLLGCAGCYLADNIYVLMLARFVQAFGGSTGSVIGQTIARDAFESHERGYIFSTIGVALAFAPAIGPVIGGYTDHFFGWSAVFLVLIAMGSYVLLKAYRELPETKPQDFTTQRRPLIKDAIKVLTDKRILICGFLVGGSNGIVFGYYAEGPFFFIKLMGMTPSHFGLISLGMAAPMILGAYSSRTMLKKGIASERIIMMGSGVCLIGSLVLLALAYSGFVNEGNGLLGVSTCMGLIMFIMMGIPMIVSNCLSSALEHYSHMTGTAASFFGGYYYLVITLMTGIMGSAHNGTSLPMPLYFVGVTSSMIIAFVYYTKNHKLRS